jgi:hypothetical protein
MNPIKTACAAGIFACALLSSYARAGDVAYAMNQANGAIVLTDDRSTCPQGSQSYYATDASGQATPMGCWMYSNPWIVAKDFRGVTHQWPIDQFSMTDYAKARYSKGSM